MGSPQESLQRTLVSTPPEATPGFYTPPEILRPKFDPPTLVDLYHRPADVLARHALEVANGELDYFVPRNPTEDFRPTFFDYGMGLVPLLTLRYLQNIVFDLSIRTIPPRSANTKEELFSRYASVNMRLGWDLDIPPLRVHESELHGPQISFRDKQHLPRELQTHSISHILQALYLSGATSYFLRNGYQTGSQMYQNRNQFANVRLLVLPLPSTDMRPVYSGGMVRLDRAFQIAHLEPTYANLLTQALENVYITSEFFQDKLRCLISTVQK